MTVEPRYFIEIVEGAHRLPHGSRQGYATLAEAKKAALGSVDDALPRNYVRVYLLVGEAHFGGDGEAYYRDLTAKPEATP